jgi:hydrogenase expression/formation protein HypC
MCLAIPGKIIKIEKEHRALTDFDGVKRFIQLDLFPNAGLGDYVIVHAGFAIQKLMPRDAKETQRLIREVYGDISKKKK